MHTVFFYLYVACYAMLYLPVILLVVLILATPTAPSAYSTSRIMGLSSQQHQHASRNPTGEGPTVMAKLYLVLATMLSLPATLFPPSVMLRLLQIIATPDALPDFDPHVPVPPSHFPSHPLDLSHDHDPTNVPVITTSPVLDECLGSVFWGYASLMDIFLMCSVLSLVFWFLFVRMEFGRVKERCIWETVSRVQDTFGFLTRPHPDDEDGDGMDDDDDEGDDDRSAAEDVARNGFRRK